MARYDRVAALPPPDRSRAYTGWAIFQDVEPDNVDHARRARIRFLALRLVRRLVDPGIDAISDASFERQLEGIREALGLLPARDPERTRTMEFLQRIRRRTPIEITIATLDMGEAAEVEGLSFTAEEFFHAALDLASTYHLTPDRSIWNGPRRPPTSPSGSATQDRLSLRETSRTHS